MTMWGLALCCISGIWVFIYQDIFIRIPPEYRFWSIAHGVLGQLWAILFGMSLTVHAFVYLRHTPYFKWGILFLIVMIAEFLTVFLLYYGNLEYRVFIHFTHVVLGFAVLMAFLLHWYFGKNFKSRHQTKI